MRVLRSLGELLAKVQAYAMGPQAKKKLLGAPKPKPEPVILDYTPSYSGFIRWRSNPNWPGRRAAAALRTSGKTRRMR